MRHRVRVIALILASTLALAATAEKARAQAVTIVALGASNTEGMGRGPTNLGVSREQAYPAQLERLLRARGVDARVINAGIAGDTTSGMLARLDAAVPSGTRVLILQPGGNDARGGAAPGERAANIAAIRRRMQARRTPVVVFDRLGAFRRWRLPDGQHYSAEGHAAMAAQVLPQVLRALGR
jgi:acyl-CoA thioesterase I